MECLNESLLLANGFVAWSEKDISGYYRRVTFKKTSLMGPVAEYFADDYIITKHSGTQSVRYLLDNVSGITDVVTQRFLLVGYPDETIQTKSFWLGFKGWLKIRGCTERSDKECKAFTDLLHLALEHSETESGQRQ